MRSVITIVAEAGQVEGLDKVRAENYLHSMRQWVRQETDREYEIITVEQNTGQKVGLFEDAARTLAQESSVAFLYHVVFWPEFKRGWTLNVGAKLARGEELVFADADLLVGTDYMERLDSWIEEINPLSGAPWSTHQRLTETGRLRCIESLIAGSGVPDFVDGEVMIKLKVPDIFGAAGAISFFQRDFFFDSVGGWNESFTAGAGSDNDMAYRASMIHDSFHSMPYKLLHLWHPGKLFGLNSTELWQFTKKHPELITATIKQMGIAGHIPSVYTIEELVEAHKLSAN